MKQVLNKTVHEVNKVLNWDAALTVGPTKLCQVIYWKIWAITFQNYIRKSQYLLYPYSTFQKIGYSLTLKILGT